MKTKSRAPKREIVSRHGFILDGRWENISITRIPQIELEVILRKPTLGDESRREIKAQLTKIQERRRQEKLSRK